MATEKSRGILNALGVKKQEKEQAELAEKHEERLKELNQHSATCLRAEEQIIHDKIQKLDALSQEKESQERKMLDDIQRIKHKGLERDLSHDIAAYNGAIQHIQSERKKIQVGRDYNTTQLWVIEQERWLNTIKGLVISSEYAITEEQCEQYLKELEIACSNGKGMLQEWNKFPELVAYDNGKECIHNVEKTLSSCEQIQAKLLKKKAKLALAQITTDAIPETYQFKQELAQIYEIDEIIKFQKKEVRKIEEDIQDELCRLQSEEEAYDEVNI